MDPFGGTPFVDLPLGDAMCVVRPNGSNVARGTDEHENKIDECVLLVAWLSVIVV